MNNGRIVQLVTGVALVVAFWLPWEGVMGAINGWHLATADSVPMLMRLALFAVPVGGLMLMSAGVTGAKGTRFAAAGVGLFSFGYFFIQATRAFFALTSWGLWIAIAAGIVGIVAALASRDR